MVAETQGTVPAEVLVAVVAAMQLLVQGLVQTVSFFVGRRDSGKEDPTIAGLAKAVEELTESREAEAHMLRDLYDMHKITDKDGRPIWYFPGNLAELEKEQLGIMREISNSQRDIAKILENLVRQFDRIERRADKHAAS